MKTLRLNSLARRDCLADCVVRMGLGAGMGMDRVACGQGPGHTDPGKARPMSCSAGSHHGFVAVAGTQAVVGTVWVALARHGGRKRGHHTKPRWQTRPTAFSSTRLVCGDWNDVCGRKCAAVAPLALLRRPCERSAALLGLVARPLWLVAATEPVTAMPSRTVQCRRPLRKVPRLRSSYPS